jgi:hypothetical protein
MSLAGVRFVGSGGRSERSLEQGTQIEFIPTRHFEQCSNRLIRSRNKLDADDVSAPFRPPWAHA